MSQIEDLMAIIRTEFLETQKPIPINRIYELAKYMMPEKDIKKLLKQLCGIEHKIKLVGLRQDIMPTNIEYIQNQFRDGVHIVRKENIIWILEKFGDLTPAKVVEKYHEVFDSQANSETLTRMMREMFSRGVLNRSRDVYFIDKPRESVLEKFA